MINNKLLGAVAFSALLTTSMMAKDIYTNHDYSLIGIEGGYSSISSDVDDYTNNTHATNTKSVSSIGIKLGAQSDDYRVLLTANYYNDASRDFDYIGTYGGEFDYLLNVSEKLNIYLGVNAGLANMKYTVPGENFSRVISDPYYGADAGINVHASKLIDLEIGARMMMLDATNTKNNVAYTFNNMISGYASIIFKYQMD
jgi:hypothetical protein